MSTLWLSKKRVDKSSFIASTSDSLSLVKASNANKAQARGKAPATSCKNPPHYCTFCDAKHGHPNFSKLNSSVNASSNENSKAKTSIGNN
ncbi:hypothetical protein A2U01_0025278 [Trifolium medium]|uniref:Uncharacterized protein n=1 Tax=Trifolium medium TaxID=97028 RepID=A0A392NWP3_9FABA|nr:hypothetical protein [Trifolium medium]